MGCTASRVSGPQETVPYDFERERKEEHRREKETATTARAMRDIALADQNRVAGYIERQKKESKKQQEKQKGKRRQNQSCPY